MHAGHLLVARALRARHAVGATERVGAAAAAAAARAPLLLFGRPAVLHPAPRLCGTRHRARLATLCRAPAAAGVPCAHGRRRVGGNAVRYADGTGSACMP
eukprot:360591-Chlamydomonas_euryale.AAC.3